MGMARLEWPSWLPEPLPAEPVAPWAPRLVSELSVRLIPSSRPRGVPPQREGELPSMELLPREGRIRIVPLWSHPKPTWMCPLVSPALGHLQRSLPTPTIPGFWDVKQLQGLMWLVEPQSGTKLLLCHKIRAREGIGRGKVPFWEKWDGQRDPGMG